MKTTSKRKKFFIFFFVVRQITYNRMCKFVGTILWVTQIAYWQICFKQTHNFAGSLSAFVKLPHISGLIRD